MTLRVGAVHSGITVLGPGRRLGLWVAGCSIGCPGCASTHWWPRESGSEWKVAALVQTIVDLAPGHDGITVSGGEPFEQPTPLAFAIEQVRAACKLDVILYSGYTLERIERGPLEWMRLLATADALIDGPFLDAAPTDRPWLGSANQRLHLLSAAGRRMAEHFNDLTNTHAVQVVVDGAAVHVVGIPETAARNAVRRVIGGS